MKSLCCISGAFPARSLPVRGAWIEIKALAIWLSSVLVAPRAGSVD